MSEGWYVTANPKGHCAAHAGIPSAPCSHRRGSLLAFSGYGLGRGTPGICVRAEWGRWTSNMYKEKGRGSILATVLCTYIYICLYILFGSG